MVSRKRPVPFQQLINTDEQWERMLQKEGLIVVDIYSEWCGPCTAMIPNFKKIKRELVGHNLHLATAKSDSITHLKEFRNRSEPTWMFLIEGKIVNIMYGANAPKLMRLITNELNKENAVKAGMRERIELEITDLPKVEVERENVSIEIVDQIPEKVKPVIITDADEELIYRPF